MKYSTNLKTNRGVKCLKEACKVFKILKIWPCPEVLKLKVNKLSKNGIREKMKLG